MALLKGPETFTSCPETWHTLEDILEDGFDAIILILRPGIRSKFGESEEWGVGSW